MLDKRSFRDAMAGLGAAVNIITSDGVAGRAGCTASAVCGVTDEPPTLLVCINRSSRNNAAFRANGKLCVNVLSAEQQALAAHFATNALPLDERFAAAQWTSLVTGAPVLDGALASLDCEIESVTEVGTHTVFFCAVKAAHTQGAGDALIYYGRRYHRVGELSVHAMHAPQSGAPADCPAG
ncbi:flavin:NADH oxidoreductase subunit of alternative pyrimidine degradation pathway [Paraburkholderia ribeironis]|uniref:Flavin:NADH oxidoreductase subunit of alternative pyrimidine degradation pathway n=1 Tax=Paraburkholderia ribeironis TaxID=1247936 RepID=A0A1N7SFV8_9BURK|nr:flavin reductase [Paraburkholderia ribeironis]SIT46288.1 flavin:NADH oxidoreductase subunit of alternative pyrimidine degradation pathway [Paraburkholderia ribeironis]